MELPLWNEKRYGPYKAAALVEVLGEQGIAPEASLSGTGLSPESLSNPDTRISVRQYITICHNALQLSKTPETPFRTGSRIPLSAYGMYGFALVCSPTIREYFEMAVKYHRLATPLFPVSWREEGDYVSWIFPMNAAVTHPDPLLRFLMEQQLTQTRDASESCDRKRLLPSCSRCAFVFCSRPHPSLQALSRLSGTLR